MKTPFVRSLQVGLPGLLAFLMLPAGLLADQSIGLPNAGLELWQDGRPLYWTGSTGNISPESLSPSADAHSGRWACRLVRTQKQHVRWSSCPLSLPSGPYRLDYFVKGHGCLRNSYYSGTAYAPYTPYDTLATDSWQQKSFGFELKKDLDSLQLIFSICQTDENGLLIDDVILCREWPDSFSSLEPESLQVQILSGGFRLTVATPARVLVYDLSGHCCISERVEGLGSFSLPRGFYLLCLPDIGCTIKLVIP